MSELQEKWDRKEKLQLLHIFVTALCIIISVGVSAHIILTQIENSNGLYWKNYLDNRENQLIRMEVDNPALACTRELDTYGIRRIDYNCTKILKNPNNLAKALIYMDDVIALFQLAKEIADKYDTKYFDYYRGWINEVRKQEITAFYFYTRKINEEDALKKYGITIKDDEIKNGYLRFKKRIGI